MIKTMLLTAQLALSPIVGTNALQPKRLPNPVYGESTLESVRYGGEDYLRVMDNDYEGIDIYNPQNEIVLGISSWENRHDICISPTIFEEGNVPTYYPYLFNFDLVWNNDLYQYHSESFGDQQWAEEMGEGTPFPNICFSYWLVADDQLVYFEVFIYAEGYSDCIITEWEGNRTENRWELSDQWHDDPYLLENFDFYTHDQGWNLGSWNRTIPNYQPTIANPSVYDNIYNFYYQNLFANEALDELGAEVGNNSLTMRQWLAHTATIVSISLLACALVFLVIKIFKLIAGSISDIWG